MQTFKIAAITLCLMFQSTSLGKRILSDSGMSLNNNIYEITRKYIEHIQKAVSNANLVKIGLLDSGIAKYLLDAYSNITIVNFTDDSHGYDENGHGTFSTNVI